MGAALCALDSIQFILSPFITSLLSMTRRTIPITTYSNAERRGVAPGRYAQAITPNHSTEQANTAGSWLPTATPPTPQHRGDHDFQKVYDTTRITDPDRTNDAIVLRVVVRRVMASGTGADISGIVLT